MPHHTKASDGSMRCCDHLLSSLRLLVPEVMRFEARETCAIYVPGKNRFAHVYHRGLEASIRVYFRGDVSLAISDPTGVVDIQRRDNVEKGWDKEFPYFASISDEGAILPLAKLLAAVSLPLSERKRKSQEPDSRPKIVDPFIEGAKSVLSRLAYKRAVGARAACIAYHGPKCSICDFDFEEVYAEIGRGFIHVHHVKPISSFEEEHSVDPFRDLVPVCPNCHAMLHHRSSPSCEDLKKLVQTPNNKGYSGG